MRVKLTSWLRTWLVVLALLAGQVPATLAGSVTVNVPADAPLLAPPHEGGGLTGDVSAQLYECKIRVGLFLLVDPLPAGFTPDAGLPNYGANVEDTSNPPPVSRKVGEVTHWFLVLENSTLSVCGTEEALSDVAAHVSFSGTSSGGPIDLDFTLNPSDLPNDGDLTWLTFDFVIPGDFGGDLHARTTATAEAQNDQDPNGPDVIDYDDDYVGIVGPGFRVVSFTPSVATANPGDSVDFTLIIENIRPGSTIQGIFVNNGNAAQFEASCDGIGNWTPVGGGAPISSLASGAQAQCVVSGVIIPSNPAPEQYQLVGDVTVSEDNDEGTIGDNLTQQATSDAVDINTPGVEISKVIYRIQRGTDQIYPGAPGDPLPSVRPGDVISYAYTVTNTGDLELHNIFIVDSLIGPIPVPANASIGTPPDNTLDVSATYIVRDDDPDPLTNTVTVTAEATGFPPISAQAVASVDIADSDFMIELTARDPFSGTEITSAAVGDDVLYQLQLTNAGATPITDLQYLTVAPPLQTVGTPPAIIPDSLPVNGQMTLQWTYTVDATDVDPLVSTVRVRGRGEGGVFLYAQDQATVDLVNPAIGIEALVTDPNDPTVTAVLRGQEVEYTVTVTNKDAAAELCNVVVTQILRDPNSGQETIVNASLPMVWPDPAHPNYLAGSGTASGVTRYLVTGEDTDPLEMVFEVQAEDCATSAPLVDRTIRILDVSDVQINTDLSVDLGADGVAEIGDTLQFTLLAQNVGLATLENLAATWCVLYGSTPQPTCAQPFVITPTTLGSFEDASGAFNYTVAAGDETAAPFVMQTTLTGTDNKGNTVSIKTATVVPITTPDVLLEAQGPQQSVVGDTETFSYTITNDSGGTLSDVRVYNMLVEDAADPYGYLQVGYFSTILGAAGQNIATGSFDYTIAPNVGIDDETLVLPVRVVADSTTGQVIANAIVNVPLQAIVGVEKTGDETAIAGEPVNYTVTITNNSNDQNVTITGYQDDVLSGYGVAVGHGDFDPWPSGVQGLLGPGDQVTGNFVIPAVDPLPDPLVNTFVANGTRDFDGAAVSGRGEHEVDIGCPLEFTFQVQNQDDDPDDVLGEMLYWRIGVTNNSQATISGIVISETLNWGGVVPDGDISWPGAPGTLGAGETAWLDGFLRQITGDLYGPGDDDDYMGDTVRAEYSDGAGGTAFCEDTGRYNVFSPVIVFKEPSASIAFTGEEVTYTITLFSVTEANDGQYASYYVTVYDSLLQNPIPLHYNGPSEPATNSGWLDPGETLTTTLTRTVQASDPEELVNVVTAEFPDPAVADRTLFTWMSVTVFTGNPLDLTKTPSLATAPAGMAITYDYTVTNVSPYPVENIALTDDVLGALTVPDSCLTGGVFNLAPGQSCTISDVPYTIPLDAPDPLVNTVTASGTLVVSPTDQRAITNTVTATVDLEDANITITKEAFLDDGQGHPGPNPLPDNFPVNGDGIPDVENGSLVHYCFTVANTNVGTATYIDDIAVQDPMFVNQLQPLFEQAVIDQLGHPTDEADRLYGQESVNFCYGPVTLSQTQGDPVTNTVTLEGQSSSGYPVTVDDTLTIDILGTDLRVSKVPSQNVAFVGDEVTYTITLSNENNSQTIVVDSVTDHMAGGDLPIDLNDFDWSASGVNGSPVGQLGPGGVATYTYTYAVQPSDPDPLENTVTAVGRLDESPLPPDQWTEVSDSSRAVVAVTASQLIVRKTAIPTVTTPNEDNCGQAGQPACNTVRYTISITNIGSTVVHDVMAVDRHFDAATGTEAAMVYQGADLTRTTLAPYETAFIYYDLAMPTTSQLSAHPELDPFVNTVTAYGIIFDQYGTPIPLPPALEDPADPYDDNVSVKSSATASVDILQPNVRLVKTPVTLAAAPGQNVSYNILISNVGADPLVGLVFTDVTGGQTIDLDTVCQSAVNCPFTYGPEPYGDYDNDPATPDTPNPLDGQPYDPAHGLQPYEQLEGTVTVTIPSGWTENEFTNVAEISATLQGQTVTATDRASATVDIRASGIQVEKLANINAAPVGTPVTYTVRVTNIGNEDFNRLVISDTAMPGGSATITGAGAFDDPNDPADDPDLLEPNETFEYQYTHTLSTQDADPYVNRVTVAGYITGGIMVMNVAEATVDVQVAAVDLEKFVCVGADADGDPATLNDPCTQVVNVSDATPDVVTYYLHIHNTGPVALENLVVTDNVGTVPAITWPEPNNGLAPDDGVPNSGNDEIWVSYEYTVTAGDADPLENLAAVRGDAQGGVTVQDTASATVALVTSDLRLTKAAPDRAVLGEYVTYTLTVEHLGTSSDPITNVQIVDPLSGAAGGVVCSGITLNPGDTQDCSFTYQVQATDPSPLVNSAMATGTQNGVLVTDTTQHTLEIVTASGLSVTKQASVNVATVGETVTYTYRVENIGTNVIDSLNVSDSDPSVNFSSNPWPTSLAPGQVEVRTWSRTMSATDPDPYVNTVTVTGEVGTTPVMAQATETVFIANGSLVVSDVPSATYVLDGDTVTFTYTFTNHGNQQLTGLTVSDNQCDDAVLQAALPTTTLDPGQSVSVYCTVTATAPGPVVSNVIGTALEGGVTNVSDSATAEVAVTTGGLVVTKQADQLAVNPGDTITYTIEVRNVGQESLTNITVTDTLIAGLAPAPPNVLSAGGSFTLTGTYTVPTTNPPSSVVNTVTVQATGALTSTLYEESDTVSVAVLENPNAQLIVNKTSSVPQARPGDTVTYTFTVQNISTATVTGIYLIDAQLVGATPVGGAPTPDGTGRVDLVDLASGQSVTVQYDVQIPADWTDVAFPNTAEVHTSTATPTLQDTADVVVDVELLTLEKTATGVAFPGNTLTYTFTVTNYSTASLTNVTLSDPLIATWTQTLPDPLPSGVSTATGEYTVPDPYPNATVDNTATLSYNSSPVAEDSLSLPVQAAPLVIENVQVQWLVGGNPMPVLRTGQPITVTYDVRNLNNLEATGVTSQVSVNVGAGVTCQDASLPITLGAAGSGNETATLSCQITLPVGEAEYLDPNGLQRTLTITADGTVDGNPLTQATEDQPIEFLDLDLDMTLAITPDASAPPGETVTFTLTLTNTGASPLGCDATVADTEPCHFRFTEPQDTFLSTLFATDFAAAANLVMNPGDSQQYTQTYTILPTDPSRSLNLQVDAGYYATTPPEITSQLANYTVHDEVLNLEFTVERAEVTVRFEVAPNPPVVDGQVTYTVYVRNSGSANITTLTGNWYINPLYTAAPDGDLHLMSGDASPFGQGAQQGVLTFNFASPLPPSTEANPIEAWAIVTMQETHTGPYLFRATVLADDVTQSQVTGSTEGTITPVTAGTPTPTVDPATLDPNASDPIVDKTVSTEQAQPGGSLTWTITVRNSWTQPMDGVVIQDSVPDTLPIISVTSDRGTLDTQGQVVTVNVGTMNPGDVVTVTLMTGVDPGEGGPASLTNTACATRTGGDPVCDSASVNVGPATGGLPATGIGALPPSAGGGVSLPALLALGLLLGLGGAWRAMPRRRLLLAGAAVLVVLIVVVAVLVSQSGEDTATQPTASEAAATAVSTPQETEGGAQAPPSTAEGLLFDFPPTATPYVPPTPAGLRALLIPKLQDQFQQPVPIVELPLENRQWDVSGLGYYIGWLEGTTWLDEHWGNTVLAAHVQLGFNNPGPFWGLGDLQPGDEIVVLEGETERRFAVQSITKVDPDDWTVTAPTDQPTLTLITCTNWDENYGVFSQRLVVRAVPVS